MVFPTVDDPKDCEKLETRFEAQAKKWFPANNFKGEGYVCYACKGNSLVIRADGSIQKCTVALYDKRNTIGRLNDDGTLSINQEKYRSWLQPLFQGTDSDLQCPAKMVLDVR